MYGVSAGFIHRLTGRDVGLDLLFVERTEPDLGGVRKHVRFGTLAVRIENGDSGRYGVIPSTQEPEHTGGVAGRLGFGKEALADRYDRVRSDHDRISPLDRDTQSLRPRQALGHALGIPRFGQVFRYAGIHHLEVGKQPQKQLASSRAGAGEHDRVFRDHNLLIVSELPPLAKEELERYARHLILPEVGESGQRRLKAASVVIVGLGGLGSPVAWYLAGAGVGRIGIVDFDLVDESNLQRQTLHYSTDVGRRKTESAAEKLRAYNPRIEIVPHCARLSQENVLEILSQYDIVADGTDNFPTRYLANDACVFLRKPNVYASIFRFEGQASVFCAEGGPCYRCLYPEPPPPGAVPSCAEAGVLGVLPGILGAIQANEVLKLLLGVGQPLIGRLLFFDALRTEFREYEVERDAACPVCGENPTIRTVEEFAWGCLPDIPAREAPELPATEIPHRIAAGALLLDVREPEELAISQIEGAVHIPMDEVPARLDQLDREREILVLCRVGERSRHVASLLLQKGFEHVYNIGGGINAYARLVDPSLPVY